MICWQIEDKVDMLCAHYALLEAVIGHMTTGQSPELDKTGVIQLHSALTAALSSVLYFLSQVAASQPQQVGQLGDNHTRWGS